MSKVTGECPVCHGPLTGGSQILLNAEQVAEMIGNVTAEWVRRTVPGKRVLGHSTVRWRPGEVLDWIDNQ
jgi:predicted DNA-binding transcriptional regulator AlpA